MQDVSVIDVGKPGLRWGRYDAYILAHTPCAATALVRRAVLLNS